MVPDIGRIEAVKPFGRDPAQEDAFPINGCRFLIKSWFGTSGGSQIDLDLTENILIGLLFGQISGFAVAFTIDGGLPGAILQDACKTHGNTSF